MLDAAVAPPETPGFETVMTSELLWLANRPVTDLLRYRAAAEDWRSARGTKFDAYKQAQREGRR